MCSYSKLMLVMFQYIRFCSSDQLTENKCYASYKEDSVFILLSIVLCVG